MPIELIFIEVLVNSPSLVAANIRSKALSSGRPELTPQAACAHRARSANSHTFHIAERLTSLRLCLAACRPAAASHPCPHEPADCRCTGSAADRPEDRGIQSKVRDSPGVRLPRASGLRDEVEYGGRSEISGCDAVKLSGLCMRARSRPVPADVANSRGDVQDDGSEDDLSYVKLIDYGKKVLVNRMHGYLRMRLVQFLSTIHTTPHVIYLSRYNVLRCPRHFFLVSCRIAPLSAVGCPVRDFLPCPRHRAVNALALLFLQLEERVHRHGQSEYNVVGKIGGDPPLSAAGEEYAERLGEWVPKNVWAKVSEGEPPRSRNHELPCVSKPPVCSLPGLEAGQGAAVDFVAAAHDPDGEAHPASDHSRLRVRGGRGRRGERRRRVEEEREQGGRVGADGAQSPPQPRRDLRWRVRGLQASERAAVARERACTVETDVSGVDAV